MKKRWPWLVGAAALLAALTVGWFYFGRSAELPPAATVRVERGLLVETADATGTIEPHRQVEVKSRVSGEIIEVLVVEGDEVAEGQTLVRLDPTTSDLAVREARASLARLRAQLVSARAGLSSAQAQEREADEDHDVQARGVDLGVVAGSTGRSSRAAADVARATTQARRAEIQSAQAQVVSAQVQLEDAERQRRETEIRAPFAGTALSVDVEEGLVISSAMTSVSGGSTLVTIADLSDLRVIGQIDEAQVGRVQVDQQVTIRVDAYPDRTFEGIVVRVSPLGVETSSVVTFDVEIRVTDADAAMLRSGMSADLEIETARRDSVLFIPLIAVQTEGRLRYVALASGERREITTGATDGTRLEVVTGLQEGDELRVDAAEREEDSAGLFAPPPPPGGP